MSASSLRRRVGDMGEQVDRRIKDVTRYYQDCDGWNSCYHGVSLRVLDQIAARFAWRWRQSGFGQPDPVQRLAQKAGAR